MRREFADDCPEVRIAVLMESLFRIGRQLPIPHNGYCANHFY